MSEAQLPVPVEIQPLVKGTLNELLTKHLPVLERASKNANAAMVAMTQVETEEEANAAIELLARVSTTYGKMQPLRKEITVLFDKASEYLIDFERPLATESGKKNEYNRIKGLVASFEQRKIKREAEEKERARKQKEVDQAWVDLKASIKLNVADVIIEACRFLETQSQQFFETKDLKEFDDRAKSYNTVIWKMKKDDYQKCFQVPVSPVLPKEEIGPFIEKMKEELAYEGINAMYLEKANPILTNWKTKIPQLRETLIRLLSASETERKRLEEESTTRKQAESTQTELYLSGQQTEMQQTVKNEAAVDKIESEFREQAIVQDLEPTGPKKKVLRFTIDKPVSGLCEIIYHLFLNKKFDGLYKLDKEGKRKVDANGHEEYIDAIDWLTKEFVRLKIDAHPKDSEIVDVAKVIVRK